MFIVKYTGLKVHQIKNAIYKESLGLSPLAVGRSAPLKFKTNHLDYLLDILKNGLANKPFLSYKAILVQLKKEFVEFENKPPSIQTVIKYVKKLGFSKKGSRRFENSNK